MKKLFVLGLFLSLSVKLHCFNFTLPYTDNSQCVLQSGTTEAFTISLSSPSATAAVFAIYETSARIVVSQLPRATTIWFDGLQKTTYTVADFSNNIEAQTSAGTLSTTLSNGCYSLQVSSPQIQAEGTTGGLLTKAGGAMEYNILLSSIVPVKIYFNSVLDTAIYFSERNGVWNVLTIVSTGSAKTNTMYLYQGDVSTNTTTAIIEPITDMDENFPSYAPAITTRNNALEYRVNYSTWVTTDDKIRIHLFKE